MKNPTSIVVIESPYAGDVRRNLAYLEECIRDCFERGEAPFASHLLYTGALDDNDPDERYAGIRGGFLWAEKVEKRVIYVDHGITAGMRMGIEHAEDLLQKVVFRQLYRFDDQGFWRRLPMGLENSVPPERHSPKPTKKRADCGMNG